MSLSVKTSSSKAPVIRVNRSPEAGCQTSPACLSAVASSTEIILPSHCVSTLSSGRTVTTRSGTADRPAGTSIGRRPAMPSSSHTRPLKVISIGSPGATASPSMSPKIPWSVIFRESKPSIETSQRLR